MKKLIALLCALGVVCSLAACGASTASTSSEASETPAPAAEAEESVAEESVAPEAPEEPAPAPVSEVEASISEEQAEAETWTPDDGTVDYALPLFDDTYEVSVFWVFLGGNQPENKDKQFWNLLQENLNVSIDWRQVSESTIGEQYNLMLSSGDMTELIWESNCGAWNSTSTYAAGYDAAIADDLYVDLTDLIPRYCPNYNAILEYIPAAKAALTTDEGRLYSVSYIYNQPNGPRGGTVIREDYLEATGMDAPTNTDELLEVAKAMKSNGVQYPIGILAAGDLLGDPVFNAFGTTKNSTFKVDQSTGELVYDATSQELYDYILYFREVWENNLVSPDFLNVTIFDDSMQTDGTNGIFGAGATNIPTYMERYNIPLKACKVLTLPGEEEVKMGNYEYLVQQTSAKKNIVVTTACEDVEKALTMLDWFYSAEGIRATNYGWNEGETYDMVDGEPVLQEYMTGRNENNVSYELLYLLDEGPMYYHSDKFNAVYEPSVLEAKELWVDVDLDKVAYMTIPNLSLSQEESGRIGNIATDISSYVETQTLKWMTCQEDLTEAAWDDYCKTIEEMGLETLADAYNAAYKRYLMR